MPRKQIRLEGESADVPVSFIAAISESRKASLQEVSTDLEEIKQAPVNESDVAVFIEMKDQTLKLQQDQTRHLIDGLDEAIRMEAIASRECSEYRKNLNRKFYELEKERLKLRKSKRTLEIDIEELVRRSESIAQAYREVVTEDLFGLAFQRKKGSCKHERQQFKDAAQKLYQYNSKLNSGADADATSNTKSWCAVSGEWWLPGNIKLGHIVPQEFISKHQDLSNLFGDCGLKIATDPRNGIPMQHAIEHAWDRCQVVIVPTEPTSSKPTEFKLIVIDKKLLPMLFSLERTWRSIDGVTLKFLNEHRPAARYLYFRYVLTYTFWKAREQLDWTNELGRVQEYVWATPGRYVNYCILSEMSIGMPNVRLPETLYEERTFKDEDYSNDKQNEICTRSLSVTISDFQQARDPSRRDQMSKDDDSSSSDSEMD